MDLTGLISNIADAVVNIDITAAPLESVEKEFARRRPRTKTPESVEKDLTQKHKKL